MQDGCRLEALGIVNALGRGCETVWRRVAAGDASALRRRDDLPRTRPMFVASVDVDLPKIPAALADYDCRNNAFTLAALEEIETPVRDAIAAFGSERIAVVMGTSTSGSAECEEAIARAGPAGALPKQFRYPQLELGGTAGFVAEWLGLGGPSLTLSTACSSSARAFATARSLLRLGLCDAVVAGGSDSLCGLTMNGFASLQAISDRPCNPMSRNRSGLTLGEGAAVFLVTRARGGIQLAGVGESSEAHHMSAPDPDGAGAAASMRGALADAGLTPSAIAYLNLHGTATQLNDAMESRAVADVLGASVPCSSTKSLVGHTLGAAGATELAFCWLALAHRRGRSLPLPPHVFDGERDPALAPIRLVDAPPPGGEARVDASAPAALMTNSFGFGGNNCTLVLREDAAAGSA
ncbi:MAG: beta-ketoacyl-[acyl-carrier-protein] synthase family protein [Myxococcota bacterium]|nr:beta-ketoacyl-[acyl-carrier-protein] synthase family protein [Myxococcales bacterium]